MDMTHANPEMLTALAKAQGEIENASKNAANPHFRSKYADLAEVLNTARPVLAKHGLSMMQSTGFDGSLVSVVTVIAHASGGYVTGTASCVPAKSDAQGIGSATTYLRRYGAAAMAGIAQEDDDGNAAAHSEKPKPVNQRDQAQADDFAAAIADAQDDVALAAVASELAASKLPASLKANLRTAYTKRKAELAGEAA